MFQEAYVRKIYAFVGVAAILALLTYAYVGLKGASYMYSGPTSITVEGLGEVFATPDIATFSFRVEAKENDAVSAQNKVAETMEGIEAYLAEAGVEDRDIKTTYFNLTPRYEYPNTVCNEWGYCPERGEPKLIGYEVNQSVSVKVRDIDTAGEIISNIGEKGAMNVSGLSFTIDDEEVLKADARKKAIEDARTKAEELAQNLGARIVRMNGYWEENSYPMAYGKGGAMMDMAIEESAAPRAASLPVGENTITVSVNISYEIR